MRDAYFIRVDRAETLADVAGATGLDPDTISALERGESRRPHARTLSALAKHYGVDARDLLTETPEAA